MRGGGGLGAAGAQGCCSEHSVGTNVGALPESDLRRPGPRGVSLVEARNAERRKVGEGREPERVALNAESQAPLSIRVVLSPMPYSPA